MAAIGMAADNNADNQVSMIQPRSGYAHWGYTISPVLLKVMGKFRVAARGALYIYDKRQFLLSVCLEDVILTPRAAPPIADMTNMSNQVIFSHAMKKSHEAFTERRVSLVNSGKGS